MKKIIKIIVIGCALLFLTMGLINNIDISQAEIIIVDFDIQAAIENATDGDVIVVPDGIYGEIDFLGKAIMVVSENGPDNCIIDGGVGEWWADFYGVTFNNNESSDSILRGLTITMPLI